MRPKFLRTSKILGCFDQRFIILHIETVVWYVQNIWSTKVKIMKYANVSLAYGCLWLVVSAFHGMPIEHCLLL